MCLCRSAGHHRLTGNEPRSNPLALIDVEDRDVLQVRYRFDLTGVLVLCLDELEEHDDAALLALADVTTFLASLLEGQVFTAAAAQEKLIEQAVRLAGGVTDGRAGDCPRLVPGHNTPFQFGDNAFCDHGVDVHDNPPS